MKAALLMSLTVILLAPQAQAGQNTGTWWIGGITIIVRDFTNPKVYGDMVATRAALWSPLMQGGTVITYVREAYAPCNTLIGSNDPSLGASTIPLHEVWVCSQRSLAGAYGDALRWSRDGIIEQGYIRLGERDAGARKWRRSVVCHELGHVLTGKEGHPRRGSCMARGTARTMPGPWDAATLRSSYHG